MVDPAGVGSVAGEQTLCAVDGLRFGIFRCPPGDWRWRQANLVGSEHYLAFPRRRVVIEPDDGPALLTTRAHLVVYDAGGTFRRRALDPAGDWCTFLALDPVLLPGPRGRRGVAPVLTSRGWALQASLARYLTRPGPPGGLTESAVLALLDEAMAGGVVPDPGAAGRCRHRTLVHEAMELLSGDDGQVRPLAEVAAELGVSAYHLARVFRRHTGYSLHDFRLQLRLRAGLERVADRPRDLAGLAADLGFAHHSHFTKAFRASFGTVPSRHAPRHLPETLRALVAA